MPPDLSGRALDVGEVGRVVVVRRRHAEDDDVGRRSGGEVGAGAVPAGRQLLAELVVRDVAHGTGAGVELVDPRLVQVDTHDRPAGSAGGHGQREPDVPLADDDDVLVLHRDFLMVGDEQGRL